MTDLPPPKKRHYRRLAVAMTGAVILAAIFYWLFGPESKAGSVERRVARLLNAQRHDEFRRSAPAWVQETWWAITRRLRRDDAFVDIREELAAFGLKAIPPLSQALLKDPKPGIRTLAANVLAEIGEPEAVPTLTNALALESDEMVVSAISEALGDLQGSQTLPVLVATFKIARAGPFDDWSAGMATWSAVNSQSAVGTITSML